MIRPTDTSQVANYWPDYPYEEKAFEYVGMMIRHFPSVAVRNQKDELVAWSFRHFHGTVGNLYVMESDRGKGLGTYVLSKMARMLTQLSDSGYAHSNFVKDNVLSLRTHSKCSFKIHDLPLRTMFIEKLD